MAVPCDGGDNAARIDLADTAVSLVGQVYISGCVDGNRPYVADGCFGSLSIISSEKCSSHAREGCDDAGAIHSSNSRIVTVADINVAARVYCHRARAPQKGREGRTAVPQVICPSDGDDGIRLCEPRAN